MSTEIQTSTGSAVTQEFLGNLDLVDQVLQYFPSLPSQYDDDDHWICSRTLLGVALTCRDLSEPALDLLWRHLETILPLLKLLPGFTKMVVDEETESSTLCGPLPAEEFIIFDHYAEKVLSLAMGRHYREPWYGISPAVLMQIALVHPGPLFPRPHTMHISSSISHDSSILCLVSPTLRTLVLDPLEPLQVVTIVVPLLSMVVHSNPSALEDLSLRELFPPEILDIIPHFTNLRRLWIDFAFRGDFRTIFKAVNTWSGLKGLRTLKLTGIPKNRHRVVDFVPPPSLSLPGLETLTLSAEFDFVHGFITSLDGPHLEALHLKFYRAPTVFTDVQKVRRWYSLLDHIGRKWDLGLAVLTLDDDEGQYTVLCLFSEVFSRLCRLDLRHFELCTSFMAMTAQDVLELGAAWPKLQHLALDLLGHSPQIQSVNCLVDLANCCPFLQFLEIWCTTVVDVVQKSAIRISHPLKTLVLNYNSDRDFKFEMQVIAEILDTTFPQLESLEGYPFGAISPLEALWRARARERRGLASSALCA